MSTVADNVASLNWFHTNGGSGSSCKLFNCSNNACNASAIRPTCSLQVKLPRNQYKCLRKGYERFASKSTGISANLKHAEHELGQRKMEIVRGGQRDQRTGKYASKPKDKHAAAAKLGVQDSGQDV